MEGPTIITKVGLELDGVDQAIIDRYALRCDLILYKSVSTKTQTELNM